MSRPITSDWQVLLYLGYAFAITSALVIGGIVAYTLIVDHWKVLVALLSAALLLWLDVSVWIVGPGLVVVLWPLVEERIIRRAVIRAEILSQNRHRELLSQIR